MAVFIQANINHTTQHFPVRRLDERISQTIYRCEDSDSTKASGLKLNGLCGIKMIVQYAFPKHIYSSRDLTDV